jgi:hypothetical protein
MADTRTLYSDMHIYLDGLVNRVPILKPVVSPFMQVTNVNVFLSALRNRPEIQPLFACDENDRDNVAESIFEQMLVRNNVDRASIPSGDFKKFKMYLCLWVQIICDDDDSEDEC